MPRSLEKHKVRDVPVRLKRLGGQMIEVIASDRKKELQNELLMAASQADYTDQCRRLRNGNLELKLLPTEDLSFDQLIYRFTYLFADTVIQYDERVTAAQAGSHRRDKHAQSAHHPQPALAT